MTLTVLDEIKQSYTYTAYRQIALDQADNGKTSGEQTIEHIEATKINAQRIKRIDKTCELNSDLRSSLKNLKGKYIWLVISESWCGDSAQCLPVIAKMAEANSNIDLKIIFREENPEIMNAYLTNGTRSIPKLLCVNEDTKEVIGTWGPRPKAIQEMVQVFKQENPTVSHDDFVKNLHLWYARDKTNAIQTEFTELLTKW